MPGLGHDVGGVEVVHRARTENNGDAAILDRPPPVAVGDLELRLQPFLRQFSAKDVQHRRRPVEADVADGMTDQSQAQGAGARANF